MKNETFGLLEHEITLMQSIFKKYPQVEQVVLYGSRSMGNYRLNSDIDLTLKGNNLTLNQLNNINDDLDELNMPYTIDLSIFSMITNNDLIDHIRRQGKLFYQK